MFLREKLWSLVRPRRHQVTVLRSSGGAATETHAIRTVTVRQGGMLLDALLRKGVEYPHLCKLGDCRRCKSVLIQGEIKRASHYDGALNQDEIDRGIFLACRATPMSDCTMQVYRDATGQ